MIINLLTKIGLSIFKPIQIILIFILSCLTYVIQTNNCKFKDRWIFESVNFGIDDPETDVSNNLLESLKKVFKTIWNNSPDMNV